MEELGPQPEIEQHDEDAPLARDATWFERQLGEEWRAEEPGIYRHQGPSRGAADERQPRERRDETPSTNGAREPAADNGADAAGADERARRGLWRRR